uniref:Carbonic anhydrase n=1 Tax=Plectus sambesii TaxID=2011161 RepID=A0A914W7R8_9BILA
MLLLLALFSRFYSAGASTAHGHDAHWGYEADNGPDTWPELCKTGTRQSPININPSFVDYANIPKMHFVNYNRSHAVTLKNNGHSVTATGFEKWPERPYIYGGGLDGVYELVQFHFHWSALDHQGSEHTLGSLSYPLEAHFVHLKKGMTLNESLYSDDGLAVVGVFFAQGNDGRPLRPLERSLQDSYAFGGGAEIHNFLPFEMLPENHQVFYRYNGSLTTPGCNEAVVWTLLAEPVTVTEVQLNRLRKHLSTSGRLLTQNYRPVQPLNGRRVLFRPHNFDLMFASGGAIYQMSKALVGFLSLLLLTASLM